MSQIVFPNNLNQELQNSFGNQFVRIFINVDESGGIEADNSFGGVKIKVAETGTLADNKTIQDFKSKQGWDATTGDLTQSARNAKHAIYLPVPVNIATNFGVKYEPLEFGTKALDLAASGTGSIMKFVEGLEKAGGKLAAISRAAPLVGALAKYELQKGGFKSRLAFNPHKELLFDSPDFRRFEFTWKLIAKNPTESDKIRKLVALLRYHMHPKLKDFQMLFEYPSDFDILFCKYDEQKKAAVKNEYLPFIATSVLTGLDVDYSGGGQFSSFKATNAPLEVDIKCTFQETIIITKDFLDFIGEGMS